jgi:hypothetical protein
MRKLALLAAVLALAPLTAFAARQQLATANLCNEYPYAAAGGLNLNSVVRPHCLPGQVIPLTLDLCRQSPRLYGHGNLDLNAFMRATGQCA